MTRISIRLCLCIALGWAGACGGGLTPTGTGGVCPIDILPGYACQQATGCPVDPYGNGSSSSLAGTCDCVASEWRCTFPVCPTTHPFDLPPPFWCGADVTLPANCACHVETNPQQGESYCVCSVTADAGSGG